MSHGYAGVLTLMILSAVLYAQNPQQQPPEPAAKGGMVIEGHVASSENGEPIGGAIVTVRSGQRATSVQSSTTDASGLFRIGVQMGTAALSVVATGWETRSQQFAVEPGAELRITLRPDRPLRGSLHDVSGRGIHGALVRLQPRTPGGLRPVLETMSRSDGAYIIRGAEQAASYALMVALPGCPWEQLRAGTGHSLAALVPQRDVVTTCR